MGRRPLTVLVPLALLVAGCGATRVPPGPTPSAAPPQQKQVRWVETIGTPVSRIVFEVTRIEVTRDGWRVRVSITNDTSTPMLVARRLNGPDELGLMVFRTGSRDELEQRNRERDLPVVRAAQTVTPALPSELAADGSWSGWIGASGALPSGYWLRLALGTFVFKGAIPDGLRQTGLDGSLVWITDHAYRLDG